MNRKEEAAKNNVLKMCEKARTWWDYDRNDSDPLVTHCGSGKKVWWKCDKGHSFERSVAVFTRGHDSCPECKRIRKSIASKPEVMRFWDREKNKVLDPERIFKYEPVEAWWKCPDCGYEWKATVRGKGKACPVCGTGIKIVSGINDALTAAPVLKLDYVPELNTDTDVASMGVGEKKRQVTWRCHVCGYIWKSTIFSRLRGCRKGKMNQCPVCGGAKRALPFSKQYPDLAEMFDEDANGYRFDDISGSEYSKNFFWICRKHGSFSQRLSVMIRAEQSGYESKGCPYCAGKNIQVEDSLASRYPALLDYWDTISNRLIGSRPEQISSDTYKEAWWKCPACGRSYQMPVKDRVLLYRRNIKECPACRGYQSNSTHFF